MGLNTMLHLGINLYEMYDDGPLGNYASHGGISGAYPPYAVMPGYGMPTTQYGYTMTSYPPYGYPSPRYY